jgi:hypothetical protein
MPRRRARSVRGGVSPVSMSMKPECVNCAWFS